MSAAACFRDAHAPPCSARGCGTKLVRGQIFCRPHWFALPKNHRFTITTAFRNRWERVYQQAFQDAVEWLARSEAGQ